MRDFGVAVCEADAAQIERTGDAISRLGLIWRGLSNHLAAAAAPALEAVANAMAAMARSTGPLGIAIRGSSTTSAGSPPTPPPSPASWPGRWVAGLAAAALSVRGLATALVVLRGALIRTGIGALIVGAGELVYQFGRLVAGVGGFGEAFRCSAMSRPRSGRASGSRSTRRSPGWRWLGGAEGGRALGARGHDRGRGQLRRPDGGGVPGSL